MTLHSALTELRIDLAGRQYRVDWTRVHDISIPLAFDAPQPNFFGAPQAASHPLTAGSFVGDVRRGGSCNCATYTVTPHCNGTHTECVGHISHQRIAIRDVAIPVHAIARLITLAAVQASETSESTEPKPKRGDLVITREALEASLGHESLRGAQALIVRTSPNDTSKLQRNYGPAEPPPYFSAEFMRAIVSQGIEHLIVDLPSIDRAEDEGRLTAHRIFFGLPAGSTDASQAMRPQATVTELAYVDDAIRDGWYLLNLQVASFVADAAPSRPLLLPLLPS